MPKVSVTAKVDFFDRENQVNRPKGSTFILKDGYANELKEAGKITATVKEASDSDVEKQEAAAKKAAEAAAKKEAADAAKREKAATKHQSKNKSAGANSKPKK